MTASDRILPVVVGVDGSGASDLAVDWAACQAAAEGRRLVLLTGVSSPSPDSSDWLAAHGINPIQVRAQVKERARKTARLCAARVHETYPDLDVRHELRFHDPRDALLEEEADVVVVGTRGLGPVHRLLLGSVADTLVKHATCPTVVVRPDPVPAPRDGVLVGIAGDAGDPAVLDLAFRVARARGLPVTAYHGLWAAVGVNESRDVPEDDPRYAAERLLLAQAVEQALRRHPEVDVRQRLTRGFADQRLIHLSRGAALVVVGHRCKPFLNELVYGSAAPRIAEHAACSVAVVPYQAQNVEPDGATALT